MNKKMVKYFSLKNRHGIKNAVEELDGKGKAEFIKWYFDESKKLISKKLLDDLRKSIAKNTSGAFNNNELFVNNIKVKGVKIIKQRGLSMRPEDKEIMYQEREDLIKKLGFKFDGYIEEEELAKIGR